MNFLAPVFAWALVAVVPVILFYLAREEPVRRVVSSLMFWERSVLRGRESTRWLRVRRWMSLLAQLLFVVLVVAALIRPAPKGQSGGYRTVFVLDASASMRATDMPGGRFREALAALRRDLARTGPADTVAVVLTGDPPVGVTGWMSGGEAAASLLDGLKPADRSINPSAALSLASDLAGEGGRVVFYTDGVGDGEEVDSQLMEDIEVRTIGTGDASNAGITLFAARRSDTDPARLHVLARMAGTNREPPRFTLKRDGGVVDVREPVWDEEGTWSADWVLDAPGSTQLSASTDGGDMLADDDSAEISVPAPPALRVILVTPPDPFLEAAFQAVPGVQTERLWPPNLPPEGDPDALWVFRGITPPADFPAAAMVLLTPERGGEFGKLLGDAGTLLPVTAGEDAGPLRNTGFSEMAPASALAFQPPSDAQTFAHGGETPLIFGKWEGDADTKWLVLAFDPTAGDMITRTAFPIFIANIVRDVRGGDSSVFAAGVPGPAATKLQSPTWIAEKETPPPAAGWLRPWGGVPPWWIFLAVAAGWLLLEWAACQRRVFE